MTNVDEALKQFARDSADAAPDQDFGNVVSRARRSRRLAVTRAFTVAGVAVVVAATVATVVALHPSVHPQQVAQPGESASQTGTLPTQDASSVTCGASTSSVVTEDATVAFAGHCVARALSVNGIATVSPLAGVAPPTLSAAVALLSTASSDFYFASNNSTVIVSPTSSTDVSSGSADAVLRVKKVIAAYGLVTAHGTLPGAAAAGFADVPAWVLAWQTPPRIAHCPLIREAQAASFNALPPLGPLADWHFLVVPSDGHPPVIVEPQADLCDSRSAARVDRVFRHEQPAISAAGDLRAYNCGGDGNSLEYASVTSGDRGGDSIEAPVGIPVDMTGCVAQTQNIGADWGAATPAPPRVLTGWPAGLPKP